MKELIKNSNEIPHEGEILFKREKPKKTIPCMISDRERLSKDEITLERRTVHLEKKAAYGMEQENTYGNRTEEQDNHGTASFIRKPDIPGKTGGIIRSKTEDRMRGIVRNSLRYVDTANGREGERREQHSPILEDMTFSAMNQGELEDRTSIGAAKHTYRLAKHSVAAGRYTLKKYAADRKQLIKAIRTGTLNRSQIAQKVRSQAAKNIREAGQSISTTLQHDIRQTVEEFDGSDDLGIQAMVKTKDAYFSTKAGIHGIWKAKENAAAVQHTLQSTAQAMQTGFGSVKRIFSNPTVIKGTLISIAAVLAVGLLLAIISCVGTIIPTITLKADERELTKTYAYITEKDAALTEEIRSYPHRWEYSWIDEFHYYVNGYETTPDNITILTNADNILLYFDCKYDDYKLDGPIYGLFGGTTVKGEVDSIHGYLYAVGTHEWTEEIHHSDGDSDWTEYVYHLDINISTKNFDSYLYENLDSLLTEDEQGKMEALKEAGQYTTLQEIGSPFSNTAYTSQRYGWYVPSLSKFMHNGVDLAASSGTQVLSGLYGRVSATGTGAYGRYVTISNGDRAVTYSNLGNVLVSRGQDVTKGAPVGTTGQLHDGHGTYGVHIEYQKKGEYYCPSFYIENLGGTGGASGTGSADIVEVAMSQVGQVGGEPYWRWAGFNSRVSWCACFVSWCANQCGYIDADIIPFFTACQYKGIPWFQSHGQWQPRGYAPNPGEIIFFDWEQDGYSDHVGIVRYCDGSTVYTVEGNSSNRVRLKEYNINSASIVGYGIPQY